MLKSCLYAAVLLSATLAGLACSTTKQSSMQRLSTGNCDAVLSSATSCVQRPGKYSSVNDATKSKSR